MGDPGWLLVFLPFVLLFSIPVLIVGLLLVRAVIRKGWRSEKFSTPLTVAALLFVALPLLFSQLRLAWYCRTESGLTLPAEKVQVRGILCEVHNDKLDTCLDLLKLKFGGRYFFEYIELQSDRRSGTPGIGHLLYHLQRGTYRLSRGAVADGMCWLNDASEPAYLLKFQPHRSSFDPSELCIAIRPVETPQSAYIFFDGRRSRHDGIRGPDHDGIVPSRKGREYEYPDWGLADSLIAPVYKFTARTVRERRTGKVIASEINFGQNDLNVLWGWFNQWFFPIHCRLESPLPENADFLNAVFSPPPYTDSTVRE